MSPLKWGKTSSVLQEDKKFQKGIISKEKSSGFAEKPGDQTGLKLTY
jgi:hypothetical protein